MLYFRIIGSLFIGISASVKGGISLKDLIYRLVRLLRLVLAVVLQNQLIEESSDIVMLPGS